MERKLSVMKYLMAFFLTLVVFLGGIFLGIFIENLRLQDAKQNVLLEKANLQSLQLQQSFIGSDLADCNSLNRVLEGYIEELGQEMATVIEYEKNSFLNEEEFNLQLREYFLTEIQYLLLSKEIDKKCFKENVKVIYFYDENEQDTEGDILDYLKKLFGSRVLVFSLNSNFNQEPMIRMLLDSYDIKQFPSVIVDKQIFQGHTGVKELHTAMCREFKTMGRNVPESCLKIG